MSLFDLVGYLLDQALVLGIVGGELALLFVLQSDHLALQALLDVLECNCLASHALGENGLLLGPKLVDLLDVGQVNHLIND